MKLFTLLSFLLLSFLIISQEIEPVANFSASSNQRFGFDDPSTSVNQAIYKELTLPDSTKQLIPIKSVGYNQQGFVDVKIQGIDKLMNIDLIIPQFNQKLGFKRLNDSTITVTLTPQFEDYSLQFFYNSRCYAELEVRVFKQILHPIVLIEINESKASTLGLINFLDSVYRPSNIRFKSLGKYHLDYEFSSKDYKLANPSVNHDIYTAEMRDIRDLFLQQQPGISKEAYFIFLTPDFNNDKLKGYMARHKALAFIPANQPNLFHSIARQLGFGIGMLSEISSQAGNDYNKAANLMDSTMGFYLSSTQWSDLRHDSQSYSIYDGDEDVITNNGLVAYYFWEEDQLGNIKLDKSNLIASIKRPYKKNYTSYHLNIQDELFKIIWQFQSFRLCWWHIIAAFVLLVVLWTGKWYRNRIDPYYVQKIRFIKWNVRLFVLSGGILAYYVISNLILSYEVKSGLIEDFKSLNYEQVNKRILHNVELKYHNEKELESEILIKRDNNWYVKHRQKVLYFAVIQDSLGNPIRCYFLNSNDSLILFENSYRELAQSHYMVFNHYNEKDSLLAQKAYNHLGIEVSNKLEVVDPAKRILLLVNGYRPTSIGQSFKENFNDVIVNGAEYPNSTNQVYSFDRYDYWKPWQEIDEQFKRRINPAETFYADGHHSVSTSNHRSLINFTKLSSLYPQRCDNPKKHNCTKASNGEESIGLLPVRPNKTGFNERVKAGRIAGKNIFTVLNEIPNHSNNDTLYIVAHSMGYAYALGIIEELRGKINFGSFYIIAAENASSGSVNLKEWKSVWQYGSKLNDGNKEYPCLQDGIAPQICAGGLTEANRVYIPKNLYNRKGFFDSHFIGYYSWILSIKKGSKGYVQQN